MSDSVITVVTDDNYLPHAKALVVACVKQGAWEKDFCLLCNSGCNTSSVQGRGIEIFRAPEIQWTNAIKFRLFSPGFRKWKTVLYLDCDILIQGSLNETCAALSKKLPNILCDGPQGSSILDDWVHFDKLSGGDPKTKPEIYAKLRERFPHIDKPVLTSDALFFDPSTIPEDTTGKLFAIQEEFKEINPRSYDQQVMDLLLYDRMESMTKDHCTWFAFDDPGNRVVSVEKGWRGDEAPSILHYWGAYAPWIIKTPDAGAYFNHRLGRVCHELYAENLAAFEKTFPLL